jgi:hypothetical protein
MVNLPDVLNEDEKQEFAHAMMVIMRIVHEHMEGAMSGAAGLMGVLEDGSVTELAEFHFEIHDATLCDGGEDHEPLINHPGSGSVQ